MATKVYILQNGPTFDPRPFLCENTLMRAVRSTYGNDAEVRVRTAAGAAIYYDVTVPSAVQSGTRLVIGSIVERTAE